VGIARQRSSRQLRPQEVQGPLSGPMAVGDQCPEGSTLYKYPGPGFAGIGDNSAEASCYTWVDQDNTLGGGNDISISTGNVRQWQSADAANGQAAEPVELGGQAVGVGASENRACRAVRVVRTSRCANHYRPRGGERSWPESSRRRPETFAKRSIGWPPIRARRTTIFARSKACRTGSAFASATGGSRTRSTVEAE
jgi:hypothetical protein